ncbi:Ferrichrome-iron receptor precursor [Pigmentiphaga humi]|uniref:Ferrichrome-iron receptor n=1 Tax=Pigmentiphaga humi TaxID=2478468 RepID=A0A3P4AX32_9BURK|nr:TonB-dependent siderophore receptor [Pigmentiphaga humi]VCU68603.1 Ferrichrome-iron receptor precursor [Pigmentiphaga humi]
MDPVRSHTRRQRPASPASLRSLNLHALARAITLAAGAPLFAAAIPAAYAQAAEPARTYDIPAGPLVQALNRFGREAGVMLSFTAEQTRGLQSPGLRGSHSVPAALRALLAGTGLEAVAQANGGYVLRAAPVAAAPAAPAASTLPEIAVTGTVDRETADGPVQGLIASRSATATKTDTPLLETPQTLTVIPREQLELQEASTVTHALQYAPGALASFGATNTHSDVVQTRGFYPRDYLDGLRLPFSQYSVAVPQFDPYMLERIELLQGPASVLFGQSSPGGILNMVSRRPQATPSHEVLLQGGNFDRLQLAFDTTGPIDDEGKLLYRLTGLARGNDGLNDFSHEKRRLIAPSFTWRPSADTSLTLLTHYQHDDLIPQYQALPAAGTLLPNPNGQLPRERFSGEPGWDRFDRKQYGIGYALEHRLNPDWTLRQNVRYTSVDVTTRAMAAAALGADQRTLTRVATMGQAQGSVLAVDNQAQARFSTGGLDHTLLLGVDVIRQRDDYRFASQLASDLDLYAPVYGSPIPALAPRLSTLQEMTQVGLYAQDQIRTGRWVFTVGGRYDRADADTDNRVAGSTVSRSDKAFSGRIGVNYLMDGGIAPYASYSTSFEPTLGTDFDGTPFEPTKGRQAEVGVKYQPEGGNLLLTLAAYKLTQSNVLTPDTAAGHTGFSVQTGEVEINGISAEARMQPVRNVSLIAAYAYTDSEVTRANPNSAGVSLQGKPLSRTPRHTASLWAGYHFTSGPLDGFTAGMGVRYLGSNYADTAISMRLPSLTLLDMALHYDFGRANPALPGWKLSLGVANLADKQYVSYCLNTVQCFWGQPRTFQVTLRKRW